MKTLLLIVTVLLSASAIAPAQSWTQTTAPSNLWQCVACSADGSKLVAGTYGGFLYTSTNSGGTWAPAMTTNELWSSVASSADGTRLLAASVNYADPSGVYISTNSGTTWSPSSLPNSFFWGSVASSGDGRTLVAAAPTSGGGAGPGAVYVSTNCGTTWTSNAFNNVVGVAASADGKKMVLVTFFYLWFSTNSGTTWTQDTNGPSIYWTASPSQNIASSADGSTLILGLYQDASYNPEPIYISTNSGATWNMSSGLSNKWNFVASSADGKTLLAVPFEYQTSPLYVSTNSGMTWTTNSMMEDWNAVASSADGGKLFALTGADANFDTNGGSIYTFQSVQSTALNLGTASNGVKVSWLVPSADFVLQQSSDLSDWSDVTNAPVLNPCNLQDELAMPSTSGAFFYRLRTQ